MDLINQRLLRRRFPLFVNIVKHYSQRIKNIYKNKIRHIPDKHHDFFFKFLKINLGRRTSYYNLYRDIKISVNNLRLIDKRRKN